MVKAWVLVFLLSIIIERELLKKKNWTILYRGSLITSWKEINIKLIFKFNLYT